MKRNTPSCRSSHLISVGQWSGLRRISRINSHKWTVLPRSRFGLTKIVYCDFMRVHVFCALCAVYANFLKFPHFWGEKHGCTTEKRDQTVESHKMWPESWPALPSARINTDTGILKRAHRTRMMTVTHCRMTVRNWVKGGLFSVAEIALVMWLR